MIFDRFSWESLFFAPVLKQVINFVMSARREETACLRHLFAFLLQAAPLGAAFFCFGALKDSAPSCSESQSINFVMSARREETAVRDRQEHVDRPRGILHLH